MDSFSIHSYQNKHSCPATLHNSAEISFDQPSRKFSMVDLGHKINIDQVMVDIKLTPLKSNQFNQKIKQIYQCLNYIKNISPSLLQQVRTAQLIIENIETKFNKNYNETKRTSRKSSLNHSKNQFFENLIPYEPKSGNKNSQSQKKSYDQCLSSKRKSAANIIHSICKNDISPIKQLDEATSRIVYTNFSIKQIESSCKKQLSHQKTSPIRNSSVQKKTIPDNQSNKRLSMVNNSQSNKNLRQQSSSKCKSFHKKTDSNFTVSNFDADDQEMERLTKNIQALDKVLQQKGLCIRNENLSISNKNRIPLKQANISNYKQSMLRSDKKPLVFNAKQKINTISNKENW